MVPLHLNLATSADYQQPLEPESPQSVELALKSFATIAAAARNQVGDRFSFDREQLFTPSNRVVTALQRSAAGFQLREH